MKQRFNILVLALMAVHALPGHAQDTVSSTPSPAQVLVTGNLSDTKARRDFIAGKIIIGRKHIDESGLRTVEELLKREPAVTVSADGRIGLLNMPGYTQILVDGQAPMAGQGPSQLDLVHVEKIEIIKSSVAEFGPFGIAGTINVVTRKTVRKTNTQFATAASSVGGKAAANLSLSHNQSTEGSPLRYSFTLDVSQASKPVQNHVRQTLAVAGLGEQEQWQGEIRGESHSPTLLAASSVTWQRGADDTVTVSPDAYMSGGSSSDVESRRWADGTTLDVQQESRPALTMFSLPVKWVFKPDKKSQVTLWLRTNLAHMETTVARIDVPSAQARAIRDTFQHRDGYTNSAELTYKASLEGGHDVKVGANFRRTKSDYDYDYRINGQPDVSLAALGTNRLSISKNLRVFAQDEWRLSESWALNAGVSGQDSVIDVNESLYRGQTNFRLWSPSLHLSKKLGEDDKRQLRLSLARSFKAPTDDDFTVRPEINPLAPCNASGVCSANTIDTADKSGNLQLRPERSLGLNLSYEHGFGSDSQVTLELFARRIGSKIGTDITLDNVPWSTSPRYVSRPANLGDARTAGINLEMELALHDLANSAPKVTVRGSAGLARSSVSSLPGPDNRLDQQTPWTGKLGATYAMQSFPLKFDVDANWSPSVWVRTSMAERVSIARRFDLDASANWTMSKDQRVVVSVKMRAPRTAQQINEFIEREQEVRLYTDSKKYSTLGVRFETKL